MWISRWPILRVDRRWRILVVLPVTTLTIAGWPLPAQQSSNGWRWSFTPYVWFAGTNGRVGAGGIVGDVNLSFSDVFESLEMPFAGLLEGRRGPWLGRVDVSYSDIAETVSTELPPGAAEMGIEHYWIAPAVGYSVFTWYTGAVDVSAGARYSHLSIRFPTSPGDTASQVMSDSWVDAIVGLGVRATPWSPKWHLVARGDVGMGGADFTWQALGGVEFDFTECCALGAIYRHFAVDYETSSMVNDITMSGPAISFALRF
jgi:hypothetical protein